MMERYLNVSLGREPTTPTGTVVETFSTTWGRVLYGTG
jgi:hypothetical protein